jgi:hypothetical protein
MPRWHGPAYIHMPKLTLRFPTPDSPGWVRFSREIDSVQKDLISLGNAFRQKGFRPTTKNIDRLIDIILLFVPTSSVEEKEAARETILDFSFPELHEAFIQLGNLMAEGQRATEDYNRAQLPEPVDS